MSNQFNEGEEIFDNVEITHVMGGENKSGFGVVYIVKDKSTGFQLALKTLQKEKISISEFNEFKKEIYPWVELSNHPNIVSAFSVDLDDNKRPYLLMEPVFPDEQGCLTLTDYMVSYDLSEELVLKWCIQFCNAMEYVNQKGYAHGDVKSDNILISEGVIKITDFGLVRVINDSMVCNEYDSYLSSELRGSFDDVSYDIYSFGVVMYQMINNGKLPLDGANNDELKIYSETGDFPVIDSDLYPLIKKCTRRDFENRYSSFDALNKDLIKLLDEKHSQKIEAPTLVDFGNIENSNKGHMAAMFNDLKNCKKYYEIAISNSEDEIILLNYALDLMHLNRFSDALPYLLKLSENPGTLPLDRIYFNIGHCYHEDVCLYKSIEYYRKTIELNNNFLKAHVNLGNVYKDYGFFTWALNHYEYVLHKHENFPEVLVNIVDLYEKMKDKTNYNNFKLKLENNIHSLFSYNVGLFFKEEDIFKFLSSMTEASKTYTSQIPALINIFEFHLKNKNLGEASDIFDDIFEKSNGNLGLMISLCFMYLDKGFIEEGITKMDRIYEIASDSDKKEILFEKSILIQKFNRTEAINICKQLIKSSDDSEFKSKVYVNLGNFYSKIDGEKSFDYYLLASNLNPRNVVPLLDLATYHARNNQYFIAEGYIDQGLELDDKNYDLLFNKARLCQDQFKYAESLVYFNKCLKIGPSSEVYGFASYSFLNLNELELSLFYLKLAMNIAADKEDYFNYFNLYFYLLMELNNILKDG